MSPIDSSQMTSNRLIFETTFDVNSTKKGNLQDAYYFRAFIMLDEWEVRTLVYDNSLSPFLMTKSRVGLHN